MKIKADILYNAINANNDNPQTHCIFLVNSNDPLYQRFPRKVYVEYDFKTKRKEMRIIFIPLGLVLTFTLIEK